jgi:tRNA pseudouridine55 synthase
VLRVDKPAGPTSHDVVAWARRATAVRRIGHTGTLDPFATGLLVLCVGPATRITEYVSGLSKRYEATMRLGRTTATLDTEGPETGFDDSWRTLSRSAIEEAAEGLVGASEQIPPPYSAKKVAGERAYDLARRGEVVALEPVPIVIHALQVTRVEPPSVDFAMTCSSGTYVRAVARDVGARLGTAAYLTALRRTHIGDMSVSGAVPGQALREGGEISPAAWTGLSEALAHLGRVSVSSGEAERLRHGQSVPLEPPPTPDGPILVMSGEDAVGIGCFAEGRLRPTKVFSS